jgi:hypothetical protein
LLTAQHLICGNPWSGHDHESLMHLYDTDPSL